MKFALISDLHIRNFKFHEEYADIFDNLIESLKIEKPDYIINLGDTAHSKNSLSPEWFSITSNLFDRLLSIAPNIIILGNHDGLVKNAGRQDALSPIINLLIDKNKNNNDKFPLYFLKNSSILDFNSFSFHHLSRFDNNWNLEIDKEKINILLFHGTIKGSLSDLGFPIEHGDIEKNIIERYDFGFFGDIHKHQNLDSDGKFIYVGNLVQQNFGEDKEKGYIVYNINDKNDFNQKFISLANKKPFISIELNSQNKIDDENIPFGAKLRIVSKNNISIEEMRKAIDIAKTKYSPESVSFVNKAPVTNKFDSDYGFNELNLQNEEVQEELIDEYLKDYSLSKDVLEKIFSLNRKYNKILEEGEEIAYGNHWKINSVNWDYLFNYGAKNSINFDKLNGVVGVLGNNRIGKTSLIDCILFSLFGTTTKRERKNIHIINQNKEGANCKIDFSCNKQNYSIERELKTYKKTINKIETKDALMNVSFCSGEENLNSDSRTNTDRKIQKEIGTFDQFLYTCVASQHESLTFLEEGNTKRKEILAKFLNLDSFEKKFELAHKDAQDLKSFLKRFEKRDFIKEINFEKEKEEKILKEIENNKKYIKICEENKKFKTDELLSLSNVDISELKNINYNKEKENIDKYSKNKKNLETSLSNKNTFLTSLGEIKNVFLRKIEEAKKIYFGLREIKEVHEKNISRYRVLEQKIKASQDTISYLRGNVNKEEIYPCGTLFNSCKLYDRIAGDIRLLNFEENNLIILENEKINLEEIIDFEFSTKYREAEKDHETLKNNLENENKKYLKTLKEISELEKQINENNKHLSDSCELITEYERQKNLFERKEEYERTKNEILGKIKEIESEANLLLNNLNKSIREEGAISQQIQYLTNSEKEYYSSLEEYNAYNLFLKVMHSNGIPYQIIRDRLPIINEEIAKVLQNFSNFEIFFEGDGKKLDIFIKTSKYEPRPIEMASGAEKAIASFAIRLALINVSNLPKSNFLILDEPGTSFDSENLDNFIQILEMAKSKFEIIFLISHIEALKDVCDMQIDIEKENGYAKVEVI